MWLAAALVALGAALIAAVRAFQARRLEHLRRLRASENIDTFLASFAAERVNDQVIQVVYDYLSDLGHGFPIAPRRLDHLWKDQGIDYPEELAEVLSVLLGRLGQAREVRPVEVEDLRTVADVVKWLHGQVVSAPSA